MSGMSSTISRIGNERLQLILKTASSSSLAFIAPESTYGTPR